MSDQSQDSQVTAGEGSAEPTPEVVAPTPEPVADPIPEPEPIPASTCTVTLSTGVTVEVVGDAAALVTELRSTSNLGGAFQQIVKPDGSTGYVHADHIVSVD